MPVKNAGAVEPGVRRSAARVLSLCYCKRGCIVFVKEVTTRVGSVRGTGLAWKGIRL